MEDKYLSKRVNPLIEDIKSMFRLSNKDEWLMQFKADLSSAIDMAYEDGFQDGADESDAKANL